LAGHSRAELFETPNGTEILLAGNDLLSSVVPCPIRIPEMLPRLAAVAKPKNFKMKLLTLLLILHTALATFAAENAPRNRPTTPVGKTYELGPDSLPQEGVPKGKLEGPFLFKSQVISNTVRKYWIFVPAQYRPEKPACVLVFQDGQRATRIDGSLRVPQVMENLIHKKEMPVTIGIFITPGARGDEYVEIGGNNPNNRAAEYDALGDRYARFLIDEMLPEVGKTYNLTTDPEGRAIGGTSSGAICAFTVAWERPDAFRKVISCIGSYTSIGYRPARDGQPMVPGGDLYPTLIRRAPPKPIRIFLQDGSNDIDNQFGSWFLANQQMLAALNYANRTADQRQQDGPRYQVTHVWGEGPHSDNHGGAILPDILRWIWKDYPK
jgi:enterochelin esterase-like enzyme